MIIVSYLWGRKVYKVNYNLVKLFVYFVLAIGIYFIGRMNPFHDKIVYLVVNNLMILMFVTLIYLKEVRGKLDDI